MSGIKTLWKAKSNQTAFAAPRALHPSNKQLANPQHNTNARAHNRRKPVWKSSDVRSANNNGPPRGARNIKPFLSCRDEISCAPLEERTSAAALWLFWLTNVCVCVCTRTREEHKGEDEAGFLKSDPGLTTPEEGDAIGRGSLTPRERAARKGCLVQGKYTRARVAWRAAAADAFFLWVWCH